jgi:hypothetical protein
MRRGNFISGMGLIWYMKMGMGRYRHMKMEMGMGRYRHMKMEMGMGRYRYTDPWEPIKAPTHGGNEVPA